MNFVLWILAVILCSGKRGGPTRDKSVSLYYFDRVLVQRRKIKAGVTVQVSVFPH